MIKCEHVRTSDEVKLIEMNKIIPDFKLINTLFELF